MSLLPSRKLRRLLVSFSKDWKAWRRGNSDLDAPGDPQTSEQKLRLSFGITVDEGVTAPPPFNVMTIPAGLYACFLFELNVEEFEAAWNYVVATWLPNSGWADEAEVLLQACGDVMRSGLPDW